MQIGSIKGLQLEWRANMERNEISVILLKLKQNILNFFQTSKSYYFISNTNAFKIEFISPDAQKILGYPIKQINKQLLLNKIHPEDFAYYLDFETYLNSFFKNIAPQRIKNFKARLDYRIQKKDGTYVRILEEVTPIDIDNDGFIIKTHGSHTQISHLEAFEEPKFSIIGLAGEDSFINIDLNKVMRTSNLRT